MATKLEPAGALEKAMHPFEAAGMGTGPFTFVAMWSFPPRDLAEKNPSAYNAAMQDMPKLKGGCGTCSNCGMAISNICIVRNAQGEVYGVGSDCVMKTEDKALGDKAKVAVARHEAELRRARNEEKRRVQHEAWLAKVCNEAGETNAQRIARENQEHADKVAADKAARLAKGAKYAKISSVLAQKSNSSGDFCSSISTGLQEGYLPSGRGLTIVIDIYAKTFGRRGTAAYEAAATEAEEILK